MTSPLSRVTERLRSLRPNTKSLRFRATVWTALAIVVLVLVAEFTASWLVTRSVRSAFDDALQAQADDRITLLTRGADPQFLTEVVGEHVVAVVVAPDGTVLASAGTPEPEAIVGLAPGITERKVVVLEEDHDETETETEQLRIATSFAADGSQISVGNQPEAASRTITTIRWLLLGGGPLIALAAALIIRWLVGRSLRPVSQIRDDLAGVVEHGSVGRIGEPGTSDEVHDLAVSMNSVLDQLERQHAARRKFVSDASHELKSPVANVRALLETGGSTDQAVHELDRLQGLIDDLLFLARTDEAAPPRRDLVDLDDVLFDEAERLTIRSDRVVDASNVQPAQVLADRNEVARAVRNLLENAARHAATRVTLTVTDSPDGWWTVIVDDDGPGIPVDERTRIFERFTRLDHDRARRDGGTGLGLSIVASIAERNGGRVRATENAVGGARFELSFPAPAAGAAAGTLSSSASAAQPAGK